MRCTCRPKDESPAAAYAELTGDHRLYNAAAYALLNGEHVVHREGEPRAQYATPAWVTGGSNTEYYSEVVDAVSPIGGTIGTSGHISDAPSHLYASATAEEVAQGAASAVYYSEILDPVDRKSTAADPKGAPRHTCVANRPCYFPKRPGLLGKALTQPRNSRAAQVRKFGGDRLFRRYCSRSALLA